ncbi:MAG: serine hydrolase [Pseudomonadota bacterium]
MSIKWLAAATMYCMALSTAGAATPNARLDQVVQSFAHSQNFFGSVLVAKGGNILLEKGYGAANREWNVLNTPCTVFRLGSLTKQFTAAAVLLLAEDGKLDLDDYVVKHLHDAPPAWHAITIRHLLTHTSGLPNFTSLPNYGDMKLSTRRPQDVLVLVRDLPLEFAPGEKFQYSNSGYTLLGLLIEKISGRSWQDFLQSRIFSPLKMRDSGVDSNKVILARRAAGYACDGRDCENAGFIDMSIPYAAGALYSTTGDLLRWHTALYNKRLLKPESLRIMTTAFKDGSGFGLFSGLDKRGPRLSHGGAIEGFSTYAVHYPVQQLDVIILSNSEGFPAEAMALRLAAVANGEPVVMNGERRAMSPTPAILDKHVGRYAGENHQLWIKRQGDHLLARQDGRPWLAIAAESNANYFYREIDEQLRFKTNAQGSVVAAIWHRSDGDTDMLRLPEQLPDYAKQPIYVRGSMNDWGVQNKMAPKNPHSFEVSIFLAKGRHEFKIGSEDFKAIDLGGTDRQLTAANGASKLLETEGDNLHMNVPKDQTYVFTLDASVPTAPTISVQTK